MAIRHGRDDDHVVACLHHLIDWLDAEPPLVIGYNTYLVSDIVATIPSD